MKFNTTKDKWKDASHGQESIHTSILAWWIQTNSEERHFLIQFRYWKHFAIEFTHFLVTRRCSSSEHKTIASSWLDTSQPFIIMETVFLELFLRQWKKLHISSLEKIVEGTSKWEIIVIISIQLIRWCVYSTYKYFICRNWMNYIENYSFKKCIGPK